jgi:hypothetical protein
MATTMIHPWASELLTAPKTSATRLVRWLRLAAGALMTTVLIVLLMALAGRALPPQPDWAAPAPGGYLDPAGE